MAVGYALVPLQHWAVTSVVSLSAMAADLLVNQALLTRRPRTNQLSQPSRQAHVAFRFRIGDMPALAFVAPGPRS